MDDYAFPHAADDEARRLALFEERLDPLTKRRVERLGVSRDARCLEIGGGHGSITRWLARDVVPEGTVVASDLQLGFLEDVTEPNVEILRHDVRTDTFPNASFDLVHTRAVLMHVPDDPELLPRMVEWLRPGGWLLLEEPDFALWLADHDPVWASHPTSWQGAFPNGSLDRGRSLVRQIGALSLDDVGADAEVDVIRGGTPLAEFYRLSMEAIGPRAVEAGVSTPDEAAALVELVGRPDFLAFGFVHVGVWGRRPGT